MHPRGEASVIDKHFKEGFMGLYDSGNRSFKEWYGTLLMATNDILGPEEASHGVVVKRNEFPVFFNVTDQVGKGKLTAFFEDIPPRSLEIDLPARSCKIMALHAPKFADFIPRRKLFSLKVETNVETFVQFSNSEDGVPLEPKPHYVNSGSSRIAYPGPLGQAETRWIYPDAHKYVGQTFEDRDWFAVLNPSPDRPAQVSIKMCWEGKMIVRQFSIAPERVMGWEPSADEEVVNDTPNARTYGTYVESDIPVVVEGSRRFWLAADKSPLSMWTCLAYPVGNTGIRM